MKIYVLKKGRKFGSTFRVKGEVFEAPRNLAKIWNALKFTAIAPSDAVAGTVIGDDGKVTDRPRLNLTPAREILYPPTPEPDLPEGEEVDDSDFDDVDTDDIDDADDDDGADDDEGDDNGKKTPESTSDPEPSKGPDIKELRAEYQSLFGKKPYGGWDAAKLTEMIAAEKSAKNA